MATHFILHLPGETTNHDNLSQFSQKSKNNQIEYRLNTNLQCYSIVMHTLLTLALDESGLLYVSAIVSQGRDPWYPLPLPGIIPCFSSPQPVMLLTEPYWLTWWKKWIQKIGMKNNYNKMW
jgi:hypothetical protein